MSSTRDSRGRELIAAREGRWEDLPPLILSSTAGEILCVSRTTVCAWGRDGVIESRKIGSIRKYPRDRILEMAGYEPVGKGQ